MWQMAPSSMLLEVRLFNLCPFICLDYPCQLQATSLPTLPTYHLRGLRCGMLASHESDNPQLDIWVLCLFLEGIITPFHAPTDIRFPSMTLIFHFQRHFGDSFGKFMIFCRWNLLDISWAAFTTSCVNITIVATFQIVCPIISTSIVKGKFSLLMFSLLAYAHSNERL